MGGGDDVEPVTRSRGGVSFPAMTHRNPFATKIEMSPSRFLKLDPSTRAFIERVELIPPALGTRSLGKFRVHFTRPVFLAKYGRPV